MSDDRKKPGWAFWSIAGLLSLVLYAASVGPVFWFLAWVRAPEPVITAFGYVYIPLSMLTISSATLQDALIWYIELGVR